MSEPAFRFEHQHTDTDGGGGFTLTVDSGHAARVAFWGKGSMEGARAFVDALDAMKRTRAGQPQMDAAVDLAKLSGSPIRSQLLIGKWLLTNASLFSRIAVFEGKPLEMNLARAIMKIARMDRVGFFHSRAEAESFLAGR
jgi:hypothetical protein